MEMTIQILCLNIFLFLHSIRCGNYLRRGSSLSAENHDSSFITSPDNSFTCGFYSVGNNTNAYWLAIWFTNSKDKTVAWMANRDRPVNGHGSRIRLWRDGTMVLTDIDGSIVWETSSIPNANVSVSRAELLDSGNLVIIDVSNTIIWQSFDHPTDTLLPYQTLTKRKQLVSSLGKGSFESGYYSLSFSNDNVLRLIYDGPQTSSFYWPNPDFDIYRNGRTNYNSTRLAILKYNGMFSSSDRLTFNVSDAGLGIRRRLTMDYDGNLRVYSLNNLTHMWLISWQAMPQLCNVHGLCGRNGICVYTPEPKCSCPPGYERVNPSQWSEGCKPLFNRSCLPNITENVKFLELKNTDYYGFDLNFSQGITMQACKEICLRDCRCEAFSYRLTGTGLCFAKSALFNGFNSPTFPASIFLKLPNKVEMANNISKSTNLLGFNVDCGSTSIGVLMGSPSTYQRLGKTTRWVYLYSFVLAIGTLEIVFLFVGWWFLFKKHGGDNSIEEGYRIISSQFRTFSYNELKTATNNFILALGHGGFGTVYKGVLVDQRVVAIKKLGDSFQGEEEFWAEVNTIGKINHMNVVRMWGYCFEGQNHLLVYEYVQNSSLNKHLFHAHSLEWKLRFNVALGIARGLAYLHHECLEWVIHCDIKPENILLDETFEPKIADFGLSKLSQRGGPSTKFSTIRGTKGYMAPEWTTNLPITAKVDVYSYGVVILELVKGVRLSRWINKDGEDDKNLELTRFVETTKRKISHAEENWIDDVVDTRLNGEFNRKQGEMLVKMGVLCVEEDPKKRPKIDFLVQVIQECGEESQSISAPS